VEIVNFDWKKVVEMVGEVRGANKIDPGPIFRGPHAFWAELQLDSFLKLVEMSLQDGKCQFWVETGGGNGRGSKGGQQD
jgi:hypothetical protein